MQSENQKHDEKRKSKKNMIFLWSMTFENKEILPDFQKLYENVEVGKRKSHYVIF